MSIDKQQLETAIAALEAQRAVLGDAVVETLLAPARAKLAALNERADAEPVQALKHVSILFLDIVGSTKLSQHLDAEEVHAVMDGALARCTAIVEIHRGKVLQYAGDNLLAVFGADVVSEDDAERAVFCGLALLDEGRTLGDEVLRRHGRAGFNLRVGLHTGGVLLGGGVDAEGNIRGIAVNIAARMEQSAPAGGLRISHDTYRHVRGVFDVIPQDAMVVKGVDELIVSYLVQRAKPRSFRVATRGVEGIETRMIGRDAELGLLQDAFKRLYSKRQLVIVTIVAEAGLGKSRLLYEFSNWAESRAEPFYVLKGRANPQTRSRPYGLLRDTLAWRLQIADDDSLEAAKSKIEQGIAPLFMADDGDDMAQAHAHLLGQLIGLDFSDSPHVRGVLHDPRQVRDRGFHVAAQMLRRVSARDGSPIVLLLDDLHWADEGSLDFVSHLARHNHDVPMLLLGLTRPTLFESRADWCSVGGVHQRIDLSALDMRSSHGLADELLKKLPEVSPTLRQLIVGRAEGNPFYMEELVKMLVDEGAIETSPEHWTLHPEKLLTTHVPQTLTGVLQARLDRLPSEERRALQQASVIGLVFWDQALAAVDPRAVDALPSLVRRDLAVPHPDAGLDGVREFAFCHQILQQVTYETLLKVDRRNYHARTATWLSSLGGARADDFLGVTAEHFEKAGDSLKALEYLVRAAEHAAKRFAHDAMTGFVAKGLSLAGPDDHAVRWRLLALREREFSVHGQRVEQATELDAMHEIAETSDDDRRRADVAQRRCEIAYRTGDYARAQVAGRRAMELADRAGDRQIGLRAQQMLAAALYGAGDHAAAHELGRTGLAATRAMGDRNLEARFINILSVIAGRKDDLFAAYELDSQLLLLCRETGNRRDEAVALSNLGLSLLGFGDFARARACLDGALRLARTVGIQMVEPHVLRHLAAVEVQQGEHAQASAHARAALALATAASDRLSEAISLLCLADAELALGRADAASQAYNRSRDLCLELAQPFALDAQAGLVRVALARGNTHQARELTETLLDDMADADKLDGTDSRVLIRLTCYRALLAADDPRAVAMLNAAYAELWNQAAHISDPGLRHSFLHNIREHQDIVIAWNARTANRAGTPEEG